MQYITSIVEMNKINDVLHNYLFEAMYKNLGNSISSDVIVIDSNKSLSFSVDAASCTDASFLFSKFIIGEVRPSETARC